MFDSFSPAALTFLNDLKANNTRDWFAAQKPVYEAEIKRPGAAFAEAMAAALEATTGAIHRAKVFRIHRDVRFSKDKTPYNAHLHISFIPDIPADPPAMWVFGLGTDGRTLGCGIFGFEGPALGRWRDSMAGPKGAALIDLTRRFERYGCRISKPALKTIPRGYDKDHPHAEALRRKGFAVWRDTDDPGFPTAPGLVQRCQDEFARLMPVYSFLNQL